MTSKKLLVTVLTGTLFSAAMFAHTNGQEAKPAVGGGSGRTVDAITVPDGNIEAIDVSEVVARIDGVLEAIELKEGTFVRRSEPIGYLYRDRALLAHKKAMIAAESYAGLSKAEAEYELRVANLARSRELQARAGVSAVSKEELEQKKAEAKVALAMVTEAKENRRLAQSEADIAKQQLDDHTIVAPFDGKVIERLKNPGEAVHANQPVVRLMNVDRLRVIAYVPLEQSVRLKEGDVVEVLPNLPRSVTGDSPKRYRGKITFKDPEVQVIGEKTQRVHVELDNKSYNHEVSPGLSALLIMYPNTARAAAPTTSSRPTTPVSAPAGVRPSIRGN